MTAYVECADCGTITPVDPALGAPPVTMHFMCPNCGLEHRDAVVLNGCSLFARTFQAVFNGTTVLNCCLMKTDDEETMVPGLTGYIEHPVGRLTVDIHCDDLHERDALFAGTEHEWRTWACTVFQKTVEYAMRPENERDDY